MNKTQKQKFLKIAKRVGGIVVEHEGKYKHFKTDEEMIAWAQRINIFSLRAYGPPVNGKQRAIPYFHNVNFIAHYEK